MTTDAESVLVGSRWRGISGNVMVVLEVDGDSALIGYVFDPEDCFWEDRKDIARYFTCVAPASGVGEQP